MPNDPALAQIVPVPPRPFPKTLRDPDLLPPAKFHCFGDWLNIEAETPHDVIFVSYFARCADLVSRAAEVLGKREDAERYHRLFDVLVQVDRELFFQNGLDHAGRGRHVGMLRHPSGQVCGRLR